MPTHSSTSPLYSSLSEAQSRSQSLAIRHALALLVLILTITTQNPGPSAHSQPLFLCSWVTEYWLPDQPLQSPFPESRSSRESTDGTGSSLALGSPNFPPALGRSATLWCRCQRGSRTPGHAGAAPAQQAAPVTHRLSSSALSSQPGARGRGLLMCPRQGGHRRGVRSPFPFEAQLSGRRRVPPVTQGKRRATGTEGRRERGTGAARGALHREAMLCRGRCRSRVQ